MIKKIIDKKLNLYGKILIKQKIWTLQTNHNKLTLIYIIKLIDLVKNKKVELIKLKIILKSNKRIKKKQKHYFVNYRNKRIKKY